MVGGCTIVLWYLDVLDKNEFTVFSVFLGETFYNLYQEIKEHSLYDFLKLSWAK